MRISVTQMKLARFNGKTWVRFGDVIALNKQATAAFVPFTGRASPAPVRTMAPEIIDMARSTFLAIIAASLSLAPVWAQPRSDAGGLSRRGGRSTAARAVLTTETLSRAQIVQLIADQGYFEIADLTRRSDGRWTCTALRGPNERVMLSVDGSGHISETLRP